MIFQIFGVILVSGWGILVYSLLTQIRDRLEYLADAEEDDDDDDPDPGEELPGEELADEPEEAPRKPRLAA